VVAIGYKPFTGFQDPRPALKAGNFDPRDTKAYQALTGKPEPALFKAAAAGNGAAGGAAQPGPIFGLSIDDPRGLYNFGGGVMAKANVHAIYVGDYFKGNDGQIDKQVNDQFLQNLAAGDYFQLLAPYGSGAGAVGSNVTLADSQIYSGRVGSSLSQSDIEDIVRDAIKTGLVQPDPVGIYNLVLPPGTDISIQGLSSLQGVGGYHGSFKDARGLAVRYAVCVASDQNNGILIRGDATASRQMIQSHELAEAMTDPGVMMNVGIQGGEFPAWYGPWGEVGDTAIDTYAIAGFLAGDPNFFNNVVAQKTAADGSTYWVQKLFDQQNHVFRWGTDAASFEADPLAKFIGDVSGAIEAKKAGRDPAQPAANPPGRTAPPATPN
jgi:hypothetical protein